MDTSCFRSLVPVWNSACSLFIDRESIIVRVWANSTSSPIGYVQCLFIYPKSLNDKSQKYEIRIMFSTIMLKILSCLKKIVVILHHKMMQNVIKHEDSIPM